MKDFDIEKHKAETFRRDSNWPYHVRLKAKDKMVVRHFENREEAMTLFHSNPDLTGMVIKFNPITPQKSLPPDFVAYRWRG